MKPYRSWKTVFFNNLYFFFFFLESNKIKTKHIQKKGGNIQFFSFVQETERSINVGDIIF